MPAQQLLLSWKDHNGALVSVFENLLKKNTLVDCTLAADGQYLKAHKVVLSACSSYFELLFSQESEKNPIVILKDVKFEELEAAVNFMYSGEVEVCEDRLPSFLEVADSLQIKGLGNIGKSQDSKEKVQSVKHSSTKSAWTQRQRFRSKDSNLQSDNADQSSNVLADCERIKNNERSSLHKSSSSGASPVHTTSIFSVESSRTVKNEICRDLDRKNTRESVVFPSLASGENVPSEENPIIKTEPETDTFEENQSFEAEEDDDDDVTMLDDEGDWDEPNTEIMDMAPTSQQDFYNPSEQIKTEDITSENAESVQPDNQSSSEGAGWIHPDDQQRFSSVLVPGEPSTSASWNQEAVSHCTSASGNTVEPSASVASVGVDNLVIGANEHLTYASVERYLPVASNSRCNVSVKTPDAVLRRTTPGPSSKKFFCLSCMEMFVQKMDLERHMRSQRCSSLSKVSEGELLMSQPLRLKEILGKSSKRTFLKCSECDYVTNRRSHLTVHLRIHTGEKPFKCPHCDYAAAQKGNLAMHSRMHSGEKSFK